MASMQNAAAKRGNHRLPRNPGIACLGAPTKYSVLLFRFISASVSLPGISELEQHEDVVQPAPDVS